MISRGPRPAISGEMIRAGELMESSGVRWWCIVIVRGACLPGAIIQGIQA